MSNRGSSWLIIGWSQVQFPALLSCVKVSLGKTHSSYCGYGLVAGLAELLSVCERVDEWDCDCKVRLALNQGWKALYQYTAFSTTWSESTKLVVLHLKSLFGSISSQKWAHRTAIFNLAFKMHLFELWRQTHCSQNSHVITFHQLLGPEHVVQGPC